MTKPLHTTGGAPLPHTAAPTTPRIKAGPLLLQKASIRSASVREHWSCS